MKNKINVKKLLKDKRFIVIAIALVLIVGGLIGLIILNNDNCNESKKIKYEDYVIYEGHKGKLEKYDPSMTVDGFIANEDAYYITGKISTKEDKNFSIITFNLYDENDKLLGTAVAGLNELKKDKVYDFKALGIVKPENLEKIDHYELKSVELG